MSYKHDASSTNSQFPAALLTKACQLQALTPYQAGTLLVECFPYTPDLIALVKELAIAQKAPSSQELLSKGASRYAEKQGAADIKVRYFLKSCNSESKEAFGDLKVPKGRWICIWREPQLLFSWE